jgi:RNA polymerase sigma factor (sigma-70 family)
VRPGRDNPAVLRALAPQVLGVLVRRWGQFAACEDAVQEALLAAAEQWPRNGPPDNARAWLLAVATRRLTDEMRSDAARRRREESDANDSRPARGAVGSDQQPPGEYDDTLLLLFLCCHPALSVSSQIALTLRAVGGLSTAEIARAYLVPEATMAQRISRAKRTIREHGATFTLPPAAAWEARLQAVLQVLYLVFNEGYTTTAGAELGRSDLTQEATRLARVLQRLCPDDGEVTGLLALMLLTEARRPARTRSDGALVPLSEQDRSAWDRDLIDEGVALITDSLSRRRLGPYQLQAAIAAVHDEAPRVDDTDWEEILALYDLLQAISPGPAVALNRAVAVAMVHGPEEGLRLLDALADDPRLAHNHRLHAVRAHLLALAGHNDAARSSFQAAARFADNLPEKRYLQSRAAGLGAIEG